MQKEILVPALGESVSEGTIAKWFKNVGEAVEADETLVELETDKVTLEINAPAAGVLGEITAVKGTVVKVGDSIGKIDTAAFGQKPAGREKPLEMPASQPSPAADNPSSPDEDPRLKMPPSVTKMVAETGIDPLSVQASGKGGRLIKADIQNHNGISSAASPAFSQERDLPLNPTSGLAQEERIPMSRLRQKIAERLKDAQNTAALLTTFNEIDMSHVMAIRSQYRERFEKKYGIKLGFMSFFVKASIAALKEIPAVNAEIDGTDIVYKKFYDIGVAVSAPQGLVVPVVRNADQLSFAGVEKQINELGIRARDNRLSMAELSGGTFTITNGGIFGSLMSTPIINPPQSGILGMHKVQERPVAVNGQIEIRPMMYVALTYDHRLIDGREAVTFLVRVKECIENPERILLEI